MECEEEAAILWAERAITRVIQRYARAVDARDFDAVRACFHRDARIHYGDYHAGDLEETIAFLVASLPGLESTLHVFGTPWIELDLEAGEARVETYAINSATYPPGADDRSMQNVSGTRYVDLFARRDGSWAIVERRNQRVWAHNLPEEGEPAAPVTGPGPISGGE
ncbi:MAG: nuclear transport factor 2 family protein [Myxococcota bacterium]